MSINLTLQKQNTNFLTKTNSQDRKNINSIKNNTQTFKGVGEVLTNTLIASDTKPMIGISIIDLCSMIGPRTVVDATRNGFAATETFLRESAGLIINCLIPGVVVYTVAKALEKPIMGKEFFKHGSSKFWANQKTNNLLTSAWLSSGDNAERLTQDKRMYKYVSQVLDNVEGLAGKNEWHKIKDLANRDEIYRNFTKAILENNSELLETTTNGLIKDLRASRNIRLIDGTPSALLSGVKKLDVDVKLKDLVTEMKNMGKTYAGMSNDSVLQFSKRLTKLINYKSAAGLAIIVAAGASFQHFNRMLTKYRTGTDSFVGEADYLDKVKNSKNIKDSKKSQEEKHKLNMHKLLGTLGMGLLAVLSFGKIPTANMFQFNGIFPTMNQCRAISAVTYSGRILSAANDNELKESALRDTCTFINLYYLGDYVSKAVATLSEKFGKNMKGQLLNETCALPENANAFQKFWHWFRHTEIKGFEELANNPAVRKNRAYAQTAGLLYSCIVLGLIVPLYNKHRTNKSLQNKKIAENMQNQKRDTFGQMYQKKIFSNFIANSPKA